MDRRNFFAFLGCTAVAASDAADKRLLATVASQVVDNTPANPTGADSPANKTHPELSVLIGNYHALMPIGMSFIWNNAAGVVVDVGAGNNWRQGICAPEFSISHSEFEQNGARVEFEWGRVGEDAAVARIRSDKAVQLLLRLPETPWLNFHNSFFNVGNGVDALCITNDGQYLNWHLRLDAAAVSKEGVYKREEYAEGRPIDQGVPNLALNVKVSPDSPVRLAAAFSRVPDLESEADEEEPAAEPRKADKGQSRGKKRRSF